ncbi:MAG: cobalt ECF transporter T component CbiQ [Pseudomonadota bacterium]
MALALPRRGEEGILKGSGDSYAWGDSFLSRLDPRVKLAAALGLLFVNLAGGSFFVAAAVALTMAALMLAGRVPYRRQLLMIAFPSTFALFAVVSQTVFMDGEVFASLGPLDLHREGLLQGLFLSLRIIAGGLVIVVLGVSTPVNRLCLALRWFRVPATFVEVLQLTYRYLFDIHAEFARMRDAQRSRLGWATASRGLASSRMLGGSLFLRVYDRGVRSADAMRCRGAGPVAADTLPAPGRRDLAGALAAAVLIAALILASVLGPLP